MPSSWPRHQPPNDRDSTSDGARFAEMGRIALLAVLTAFVGWLMMHMPEMTAARAQAEVREAAAIDRQNRSYCEKWGLRRGTHEHTLCTIDLQEVRRQTETRAAATFATMF